MKLFLSLGSNIGNREDYLDKAYNELLKFGNSVKKSRIYETEPWGLTDQASFLNQVIVLDSNLEPESLLKEILLIEERLGRQRKQKWGPRVIDIDILFYGDMVIDLPNLQIPHPYIQEREFVLEPLNEIFPDKEHPLIKKSVKDIYKELLNRGVVMNKVGAIILAAGKGSRMKSNKPKVAFQLAGKSLVERVVETANGLDSALTCVIVGYKKEQVKELVNGYSNVTFAEQLEQLGTGHAVKMAKDEFKDFSGDLFILCGDVPLTRTETLLEMLEAHRKSGAACTVLTHVIDDAARYGRIIRDEKGNIKSIVEFKDATEEERQIKEINTGIYCFKQEKLFSSLEKINNDNAQNEYYLPDTLEILNSENEIVGGHVLNNFVEAAGINSQSQLSQLESEYYNGIKERWMTNGVTIENPLSVLIGEDVILARDVEIGANTIIRGKSSLYEGARVGVNCLIEDSIIETEALLEGYNIIKNSLIKEHEVISFRETVIEEKVIDE